MPTKTWTYWGKWRWKIIGKEELLVIPFSFTILTMESNVEMQEEVCMQAFFYQLLVPKGHMPQR